MEFRMLGPLDVRGPDGAVAIRGRHHPRALALLLDEANRVVPVDRLAAGLWDEAPPESARQQIQSVISGLRRQLGPEGTRLQRIGAGYRLEIEARELDVLRCKAHETRARDLRSAGRTEAAAAELRSALREWRGPVLAGVEGRLVEATAARLEKYRLVLVERRIDLDLDRGADVELIAELRQLTAEQPLQQRFTEQLMLALHRSGRTPEALQAFAEFSERLADELGIDPGRSLRDLHTAMLRADARPAAGPAGTRRTAPLPPPVRPALLPPDTAAFTGRGRHLDALDGLLDDEVEGVRLSVITGTGGVGKTALAVRWAYRVVDRFPDGQLFINLRGFDPRHAPLGPDEAVRVLLDALGVPHQRVPADPEAQFGLYRSLLAEKRTLVLLDNAADAAQVRPLIPGGRGNATVVTSRNPLYGVVASQGAQTVPIAELSADEAYELLERRIGEDRASAEPDSVARIAERCARLPLALAVTAARAAAQPDFSLAALARELDETAGVLDAFAGDDPDTDVRAVFACSLHALTEPAARLFRLLGLHPGPDFAAPAAASLAAAPLHQVRTSLTELTRAHLLTESEPGRYTFHDLLRAYAGELMTETDHRAEREAATRRVLDHYLHTAHSASLLVNPGRVAIEPAPARPDVAPEPLADSEQALAWLTDELRSLAAAVGLAADSGYDGVAWQLAWTFIGFTYRQGHLHDGIAAQRTALAAARRRGDAKGQVYSHRMLAVHLAALDDYEGAAHHLERALDLCDGIQDPLTLAQVHLNLARIHEQRQKYAEAVEAAKEALGVFHELGETWREATALNAVGWYCAHLERYDEALAYCERALAIQVESGNPAYQSSTWDSLGFIHQRQSRFDRAVECLRTSLDLSRRTGHRTDEAEALIHLGDAYQGAGDAAAARAAWREAQDLFRHLDPSRIAELQARLDRQTPPPGM
ncbi:AfsR/SARP family transcriptional regulator [Glycomyces artemisiae]|uniref:AfsR/SARP family transcriptional regulator n=1 Tax=Glycomyces artemisiae TaxID=1076443 RepID=UPI0015E68ADF|nr:AfsR/SARP family transcriptional regulator [Glycomyces artemisiae]